MIGVFDSGHGGLTVLRALVRAFPDRDFLYFGDHGHAPYGNRPAEQVLALTRAGVETLFAAGCRLVLLACNTAAAVALRRLQQDWLPTAAPDRRILGVLVPMVEAITRVPWLHQAPLSGPEREPHVVGVFGTRRTVTSGAFPVEIAKRAPQVDVVQQACPQLVAAIEAGLGEATLCRLVHRYVRALERRLDGRRLDSVVLGCTHYPLVGSLFVRYLPAGVEVLSQPDLVAASLAHYLERHPDLDAGRGDGQGCCRFLTTGAPERIDALGSRFFGRAIHFVPVPTAHAAAPAAMVSADAC